jgi:ABC-type molybdate transport system substrate-binding protein
VAEGHADIFLTYCTNALAAQKEDSRQQVVPLPEALAVGADYGLAVMLGASSSAQQFVEFIMSSQGQQILVSHGFEPGK